MKLLASSQRESWNRRLNSPDCEFSCVTEVAVCAALAKRPTPAERPVMQGTPRVRSDVIANFQANAEPPANPVVHASTNVQRIERALEGECLCISGGQVGDCS